jgi:hypothetical protein
VTVCSACGPASRSHGLRNGAEDNLNLKFVQILVTKHDDLVKSFLPNLRFRLFEGQELPLDHRTTDNSLPRLIAFHTFLKRNIEKNDNTGNAKLPRQV